MKEQWRPIPGFEGHYQVSSFGNIKSMDRIISQKSSSGKSMDRIWRGQKIKQFRRCNGGYVGCNLSFNGKKTLYTIHTLVLKAFAGDRPCNMEGAHLNGIKTDNRISNLKWVTRKENQFHRIAHGTDCRGEKNPSSRFTVSDVIEMRRLVRSGVKQVVVAKQFKTGQPVIQGIVARKTWRHVL